MLNKHIFLKIHDKLNTKQAYFPKKQFLMNIESYKLVS